MDHINEPGQGQEQYQATVAMIESQAVLSPGFDELQNMIAEELRANPFLEYEEMDPLDSPEEMLADDREDDAVERELKSSGEASAEDFSRLEHYSQEEPTTIENWDAPCKMRNRSDSESSTLIEDSAVDTAEESLEFHLLQQLPILHLNKTVEDMCRKIIRELDAQGYCRQEMPVDPEHARQFEIAIQIVQKLDPPGVAARNLQECLLNQLDPKDKNSVVLRLLISNHLEDMAKKNAIGIAKQTGLSPEELENATKKIRKLNPRPSSCFATTKVLCPNVTPDLHAVTTVDSNGKLSVNVRVTKINVVFVDNPETESILIRLGFDKTDLANDSLKQELLILLQKRAAEQRKFLQMRFDTLKSIGDAVAKFQKNFFQRGPSAIVPMTKKQIADVVGKHETTVSRAVLNKWIETPYGIFQLDEFFTKQDLDTKRLVETIIEQEDKTCPLSDQSIREILIKDHDLKVSRRVIAQYRKELRILNSRYRKN